MLDWKQILINSLVALNVAIGCFSYLGMSKAVLSGCVLVSTSV